MKCAGIIPEKVGYRGEVVTPARPCNSKSIQFKVTCEQDEYFTCNFHIGQVITILVSAHNKPASVTINRKITHIEWVSE